MFQSSQLTCIPPLILFMSWLLEKMNPVIVAANSMTFTSAFLHGWWAVFLKITSVYFVILKMLDKIALKTFTSTSKKTELDRNFMTTLHVNALFIAHAGMQRWIWNLQLPTNNSSFMEYWGKTWPDLTTFFAHQSSWGNLLQNSTRLLYC